MIIECVVVSYMYSDYLHYTLPSMVKCFDDVIVVTNSNDLDTIRVCNYNGIKPLFDNKNINSKFFKKGSAINKVLKKNIKHKDWVLMSDADIYFPDETREIIERNVSRDNVLYGAQRLHSPSFDSFLCYLFNNTGHDSWKRGEESHLLKKQVVLGFFQLINYKKIPRFRYRHYDKNGKDMYPSVSKSASHDDFYFQRCASKKFLPLDVIHLSEAGRNWDRRVSGRFDVMDYGFLNKYKQNIIHVEDIDDIFLYLKWKSMVEDKYSKKILYGEYDCFSDLDVVKDNNIRVNFLEKEKVWWTLV